MIYSPLSHPMFMTFFFQMNTIVFILKKVLHGSSKLYNGSECWSRFWSPNKQHPSIKNPYTPVAVVLNHIPGGPLTLHMFLLSDTPISNLWVSTNEQVTCIRCVWLRRHAQCAVLGVLQECGREPLTYRMAWGRVSHGVIFIFGAIDLFKKRKWSESDCLLDILHPKPFYFCNLMFCSVFFGHNTHILHNLFILPYYRQTYIFLNKILNSKWKCFTLAL